MKKFELLEPENSMAISGGGKHVVKYCLTIEVKHCVTVEGTYCGKGVHAADPVEVIWPTNPWG